MLFRNIHDEKQNVQIPKSIKEQTTRSAPSMPSMSRPLLSFNEKTHPVTPYAKPRPLAGPSVAAAKYRLSRRALSRRRGQETAQYRRSRRALPESRALTVTFATTFPKFPPCHRTGNGPLAGCSGCEPEPHWQPAAGRPAGPSQCYHSVTV